MQIVLTLKKEWFDRFLTGEKTIEYREKKRYWDARLNKPIKTILFKNGYSRDARKFIVDVDKIEIVDSVDTDLKTGGMIYAIHTSNLKRS